jgi:hypothetical protein
MEDGTEMDLEGEHEVDVDQDVDPRLDGGKLIEGHESRLPVLCICDLRHFQINLN